MMIDRLKEIQRKVGYIRADGPRDKMDAYDTVALLIIELEAKEAAQTPKRGQMHFYEWNELGKTIGTKRVNLENVIIHEDPLSNGRKWFAISGILIEKE